MSSAEPARNVDVVRAKTTNLVQKEVSWTQWILRASCLAGLFLFKHFTTHFAHAKAMQQAGAQKKQAVCQTPDVVAKQLNVDRFYIE